MEIFICAFYFVGVIVTFLYLEKMRKVYNEKHKEEVENQTREDKRYVDKIMIVFSIFSWLSFITLVASNFAHTNEKD